MLTLTSEYALRALICLTRREEEWPLSGKELARETGVPAKYLSTILANLTRHGVLSATRGKSGGFRLARPAKDVTLHAVLLPFERFDTKRCPFGNVQCSEENPCLGHAGWLKVVEARMRFLRKTTLHDVAVPQRAARERYDAPRRSYSKRSKPV